jgi:hypothetical protein
VRNAELGTGKGERGKGNAECGRKKAIY